MHTVKHRCRKILTTDRALFAGAVPFDPVSNLCSVCGTCIAAPDAAMGAGDPLKRKGDQNMNWDRIEGNWKQLKGKAKEQWGKLTDDQLDTIAGKRDQLAGKIQEQYGITKDEANRQLDEFENQYHDWDPARDPASHH
jgi:uncharacterized protein YjbJ (UPF0337 family)